MTIVNKVKALGARAMMDDADIRARLEKDHDRFKELARGMCESRPAARRKALLAELKPGLVAHARAEERTAYDALIEARAEQAAHTAHTLAREGYVEHAIVDQLLTRLSALDSGSEEWLAHAKVLRELLTEHIEEEESDTFAELGANFSDEQLISMGARFEREKSAVMQDASSPQQTRRGPRRPGARRGASAASRSGRAPAKKTAKRAGTSRRPAGKTLRPGERARRGASARRRRSG